MPPIRRVLNQKEGVLEKAYELRDRLKGGFRVKVDDTDKSPGWKFAEAEMRFHEARSLVEYLLELLHAHGGEGILLPMGPGPLQHHPPCRCASCPSSRRRKGCWRKPTSFGTG